MEERLRIANENFDKIKHLVWEDARKNMEKLEAEFNTKQENVKVKAFE